MLTLYFLFLAQNFHLTVVYVHENFVIEDLIHIASDFCLLILNLLCDFFHSFKVHQHTKIQLELYNKINRFIPTFYLTKKTFY